MRTFKKGERVRALDSKYLPENVKAGMTGTVVDGRFSIPTVIMDDVELNSPYIGGVDFFAEDLELI